MRWTRFRQRATAAAAAIVFVGCWTAASTADTGRLAAQGTPGEVVSRNLIQGGDAFFAGKENLAGRLCLGLAGRLPGDCQQIVLACQQFLQGTVAALATDLQISTAQAFEIYQRCVSAVVAVRLAGDRSSTTRAAGITKTVVRSSDGEITSSASQTIALASSPYLRRWQRRISKSTPQVEASLSVAIHLYASPYEEMTATITLSSGSRPLTQLTLGPPTKTQRDHPVGLLRMHGRLHVPASTTSITVTLRAQNAGNGSIGDIDLVLRDAAPLKPTPRSPATRPQAAQHSASRYSLRLSLLR